MRASTRKQRFPDSPKKGAVSPSEQTRKRKDGCEDFSHRRNRRRWLVSLSCVRPAGRSSRRSRCAAWHFPGQEPQPVQLRSIRRSVGRRLPCLLPGPDFAKRGLRHRATATASGITSAASAAGATGAARDAPVRMARRRRPSRNSLLDRVEGRRGAARDCRLGTRQCVAFHGYRRNSRASRT
jgi:hypothetical protein